MIGQIFQVIFSLNMQGFIMLWLRSCYGYIELWKYIAEFKKSRWCKNTWIRISNYITWVNGAISRKGARNRSYAKDVTHGVAISHSFPEILQSKGFILILLNVWISESEMNHIQCIENVISDSLCFRKQNFLQSQKTEILKNFLYFRRELPNSKNEKKNLSEKMSYISGNGTF